MFPRTILETDLSTLDNNLSVYKSFLKPSTKMMAVVKASGYGTSPVKLSQFFQDKNLEYLAVAFTHEGVQLRDAGITMPIMVFNPDISYYDQLLKYNLEPVIYDFSQFEKLESFNNSNFKIHIKIDSGMRRLGFVKTDLNLLLIKLREIKNIKVLSIFSHLAASEDAVKDEFTKTQIDLFSELYDKIQTELGYKPLKHILNSSGIVRFSEAQFDMVRLGIGMHSDDTSNILNDRLKPIHSLLTNISQIKTVEANEGVGYGRRCIKNYKRQIAILPVGYADGLIRIVGNNKYNVWLNGHFAPIIGNISMDTCFIDITNISNVKVGDTVEIFGKHANVEDLARAANTISYEIFSRISSRVKRVCVK